MYVYAPEACQSLGAVPFLACGFSTDYTFGFWRCLHSTTSHRFSVGAEVPGNALMMSTAMAAGDAEKSNNEISLSASATFPQFPEDSAHAHARTQFKESAKARLAGLGLLGVAANGDWPAAAKQIIDFDLDELPELPVTHREHERRKVDRMKIKASNAANAQKRQTLLLDAWTKIYTLMKASTEVSSPVLSRDMQEQCDLTPGGVHVGSFDGPLSWRMAMHHLADGFKTSSEKDFYRTAERLQRASKLPDGALAADYSRKALAFLVHIKPNLAQSYDDDDSMSELTRMPGEQYTSTGRDPRP